MKKYLQLVIICIILTFFTFIFCSSVKYQDQNNIKTIKQTKFNQIMQKIEKDNHIKKVLFILDKYQAKLDNKLKYQLAELLYDLEKEYQLSSDLFLSIAMVETGFNNNAKGSCGEITMVQFMKATWKEVTEDETNYIKGDEKNILYVTKMWFKYVKKWNTYFNGDIKKTVIAYNCGRHRILKSLKTSNQIENFKTGMYRSKNIKPYDEKVFKYYNQFNNLRV